MFEHLTICENVTWWTLQIASKPLKKSYRCQWLSIICLRTTQSVVANVLEKYVITLYLSSPSIWVYVPQIAFWDTLICFLKALSRSRAMRIEAAFIMFFSVSKLFFKIFILSMHFWSVLRKCCYRRCNPRKLQNESAKELSQYKKALGIIQKAQF